MENDKGGKKPVVQALAMAEDRAATATAEAVAAMRKLDTEQTNMADALIEASERVAIAEERARRAQEATSLAGHRVSVWPTPTNALEMGRE